MSRSPGPLRPTVTDDASGGGSAGTGWEGAPFPAAGTLWRVWGLPPRPPSTQAEPSRRGPWRPGRSYSGALHLDAMNHARSTCVWGDGRRDGSWGEWWVEVRSSCLALGGHERHEEGSMVATGRGTCGRIGMGRRPRNEPRPTLVATGGTGRGGALFPCRAYGAHHRPSPGNEAPRFRCW